MVKLEKIEKITFFEANKQEPRNVIRCLKVKKKIRLLFSKKNKKFKGKYYVFSGYRKRNNVRFMYLEPKLQQYSWFMHFQVKKPQNGKKNPFRDKETTTNEYLRFFDVKVLTETYLVHFGTLSTH